jgi:hypothetical protein
MTIGQPYNPEHHDIHFWRKCLNEGMAAEFSPDQYASLPTRAQQDAFCQQKLTEALVKAVRDHATANYETGGWDFVVEAWEDAEIAKEIGDATTAEDAIQRVAAACGLQEENRQERTPKPGIHY